MLSIGRVCRHWRPVRRACHWPPRAPPVTVERDCDGYRAEDLLLVHTEVAVDVDEKRRLDIEPGVTVARASRQCARPVTDAGVKVTGRTALRRDTAADFSRNILDSLVRLV